MEVTSHGAFHLDDDDRVPLAVRRKVREQMGATELEDTRRATRQALALGRLVRAARKEMQAAIGARRAALLADAIAGRRERLRRELEAARDAGVALDEVRKLGARRRRETAAILKRLGIDADRLRRISLRARRRADRLLAEPSRRGKRPAGRLVLPDDVPADIRALKSNPWTVKSPPFPGWWWWFDHLNAADFGMSFDHFTSKDTGMAGVRSAITTYDASDIDIGIYDITTSVGFWYKTPAVGLIEVWIKAQCANARHWCWLDDEWGVSDSTVRQKNYLTLRVWDDSAATWGGFSRVLMSHFFEEGQTDGTWNIQWLTNGGTYWGHLFSDLSYPKNKWVWISAGTRNWNYVYTNDVEVESSFDTRWFIAQVLVDSTG